MYQIRKGWPADAAIDESVKAAAGAEVSPGMVVTVADGEVAPANYTGAASATDPMPGFLIGHEKLTGSYTCLLSQCVIEVDSEHYDAATYKAGDLLTAKNGKFSAAGTSKAVGRVMTFDPAAGLLRLNFFESH